MPTERKLIFVVGASRTGTTLMSSILGRHKAVHGTKESHYFGDFWIPSLDRQPVGRERAKEVAAQLFARQRANLWQNVVGDDDLAKANVVVSDAEVVDPAVLFERYCAVLAQANGKLHVTEQTPRNIFYLDDLLRVFPQAYAIEMVRDPRAVLYSQRMRWRMRALGARKVPVSETLRVFANYHPITMSRLWNRAVGAGNRLRDNPRVYRCRYEDLVDDPHHVVADICGFLQVEFDPAMLAVPRVASSTQPNTSTSSGVGRDSVSAWERGLPAGDRLICERMTRSEMAALGYRATFGMDMAALLAAVAWLLWFPVHTLLVLALNPRRMWIMLRASFR